MTPEQLTQFNQMQDTIRELVAFVNSLQDSGSFDLEVETAIRKRIFGPSKLTATSKTQSVNEAGASTYSVAKPLAGFITMTDGDGVIRNIAYFE